MKEDGDDFIFQFPLERRQDLFERDTTEIARGINV
jgi:hypothetical protein